MNYSQEARERRPRNAVKLRVYIFESDVFLEDPIRLEYKPTFRRARGTIRERYKSPAKYITYESLHARVEIAIRN